MVVVIVAVDSMNGDYMYNKKNSLKKEQLYHAKCFDSLLKMLFLLQKKKVNLDFKVKN